MKILHIVETPRFSGAEILVRNLSLSHLKTCEVAIGSFNPTEDNFTTIMQDLKNKSIKLFIPSKKLKKLVRLQYLFKLFKEYQPDVVVGHSSIVNAYMRTAGLFFPEIKKIIVLHSGAGDYEGNGIMQKIEYILQYFTDCVVGVSNWSKEIYQKKYKHATCRTILNGIELENFSSINSINRSEIRKNIFGANDSDFIIIQVGRIYKVKNQLLTLQAISMLNSKHKENLKVIFAGIIEDKQYYEEIINFAKTNHLMNKLLFLGGRSDINKLLYASDVYVMPSARENLSMALIEALSTGIPTLYSGITQFDFLEKYNFENTYKIDLQNIQTYTQSLLQIIVSKTQFIQRNLDDFSFRKSSEEYLKLFKELAR